MNYSLQYAIEIANHMDFIYKTIGIRVALVGVEVWNSFDKITTDPDFSIYLSNWVVYLPTLIKEKREQLTFDNAQLVTGEIIIIISLKASCLYKTYIMSSIYIKNT